MWTYLSSPCSYLFKSCCFTPMLLLHLLVEVMENLSHKNDLNSYCQRLNTPLPVYNTTFACTVSVGGKTFTSSSSTFTNRRSAEQDAAKLALQYLLNEDTSPTTNLRKVLYLLLFFNVPSLHLFMLRKYDSVLVLCSSYVRTKHVAR